MRESPGRTRRAVLAGAGAAVTASLAGCSGLPFGESRTTVTGEQVSAILAEEPPSIPDRLPVAFAASYLDGTESDLESALASVPAPFDAAAVPNGAMRDHLNRSAAAAREALAGADEEPTPTERAGSLRHARREIGYVAGGWAAIDGDRTIPDVRDDGEALREELGAFRDRWAHLGADAIEAAVVNDAIAGLVRSCIGDLNRVLTTEERDTTTALDVAEADEHLASARGELRDAAHLLDRLRGGDGVRDRRDALASAADALVDHVGERRIDAGLDEGPFTAEADREAPPAERALRDLRDDVRRGDLGETLESGAFPQTIVGAHGTLAQIGAVETLRSRVDSGEAIDPASAADVDTMRTRAREAVVTVHEEGEYPRLDRLQTHRLAAVLRYVDERLARVDADDEVALSRLDWELRDLVRAEAVARSVGDASVAVARALGEAD
ncbi:hypothetical protein [Halobaculum magnesiiphilum]|uniref:Uncharacterized protein n=1 Tax=Halobaculum magnesiiphilum TaxID=1017351 RepID=A0A8T8WAD9_9EURY|nr:hypothetical protein [Halobaculum magnesiiphilum]QZP36791.1 hypothetical protein K6T50_10810 [Halobaculum magnesiiphilum]